VIGDIKTLLLFPGYIRISVVVSAVDTSFDGGKNKANDDACHKKGCYYEFLFKKTPLLIVKIFHRHILSSS
jgi:hypothetical protein